MLQNIVLTAVNLRERKLYEKIQTGGPKKIQDSGEYGKET